MQVHTHNKRAKAIGRRDPSLINLGGALGGVGDAVDSVPVVGPVVSPLVGGDNSQPAPAPAPAPPNTPPATQPTPTAGSGGGSQPTGGGSSGGGSSGGGSSGGGSSGGGSSGGGSSGGGSSGTGNGNGNGNGNGGGGGSGGGNGNGGGGGSGSSSPGSDPSPGSNGNGGGAPAPSGAGSGAQPSPTVKTAPAQNLGNNPPAQAASQGGTNASPTVSNAGVPPTVGVPTISSSSNTFSFTGTQPLGDPSASPTTSTSSSGGASPSGSSDAKAGHALSTPALAGIVVLVVLGLSAFLIVFCIRRTRRNRKNTRNAWWRGASYGATGATGPSQSEKSSTRTARATAGTASARSSFATTYDHGLGSRDSAVPPTPSLDLAAVSAGLGMPDLPPTAEVHHAPLSARGGDYTSVRDGPGDLFYSYEPPRITVDHPFSGDYTAETPTPDNRYSAVSGTSDAEGQYLIIPAGNAAESGTTSPMSVRPFSPTESWAFPKPPSAAASATGSGSRPGTGDSLPPSEHGGGAIESLGTDGEKRDSSAWLHRPVSPHPSAVSLVSPTSVRTLTPTAPNVSPSVSAVTPRSAPPSPGAEQNPFADPTPGRVSPRPSTVSTSENSELFAPIETIRRPFAPTLADEVRVEPGEKVRIIKAFDDGWAVVEKVPAPYKGKNKARESVASGDLPEGKGMIPIDCLRGAGEDLPAFLANKRVSSYSGQGVAM